mmetsp:Transcript_3455/g.7054  ORF Transcript_3455/g.7054 Transcript_3455/m.7054 type:complete len:87 (+) Transcript_3455:750-1010(+)
MLGADGDPGEQRVLPDDMLAEFQEIFSLIDTDGSGAISSMEICELVESVGMQVADSDLQALMSTLDADVRGCPVVRLNPCLPRRVG